MSLPDPTPEPPSKYSQSNAPVPQPLLTGAKPDALPPYTPQDWLMFALGTLLGLASVFTAILGTALLAVWFFVAKPPRSPLLRGVGLGIAIVGIFWAGALTLCFGALGLSSLQSIK